jgi:hypothetical protein
MMMAAPERVSCLFALVVLLVCGAVTGCGDPPSKDGTNARTTNNAANGGTNGNTDGGGENNDSLSFDPGVAGDRTLDTLTADEREQACAASRVYYAESGAHAAGCLLEGYTAAELTESMDDAVLRDACSERFDTCLEERAQSYGLPQLCSSASNCTGTVRQAIDCAVDAGQGLVTATESLPGCDEITFDDLGLPQQIQLPPAPYCAALNATCD